MSKQKQNKNGDLFLYFCLFFTVDFTTCFKQQLFMNLIYSICYFIKISIFFHFFNNMMALKSCGKTSKNYQKIWQNNTNNKSLVNCICFRKFYYVFVRNLFFKKTKDIASATLFVYNLKHFCSTD